MFRGKLNFNKNALRSIIAGQILIICLLFIFPFVVQAQTADPVTLKFKPQVPLPGITLNNGSIDVGFYKAASGTMVSDLLPRYIMAVYNYSLAIVGILATIVLMGGGVLWLVSGGDAGKITQAKELITGSISGTLILVVAWMILNTINPNLVNFKAIETVYIEKSSFCCHPLKGNIPTGRDGDCATGKMCKAGETCINRSENTFECATNQGFSCCEYAKATDVPRKCITIPFDNKAKCPAVPAGWDKQVNWHANFNCGDREIQANSCDAGNCVGNTYKRGCPGVAENTASWCYNEICYYGKGTVAQPCGDEPNSKCDKDIPQNGKTCDGDGSLSGRSCDTGLWCCKFDSEGKRINKQ